MECGLRQFLITELHEIQSGFKLRPHLSCARGQDTLCLRRCVGASSSNNAVGQETFLSLLAIERIALLPKLESARAQSVSGQTLNLSEKSRFSPWEGSLFFCSLKYVLVFGTGVNRPECLVLVVLRLESMGTFLHATCTFTGCTATI